MSKKKFDPEIFKPLESLYDLMDIEKAEKIVENEFNSRFDEHFKMFLKNIQNSGIHHALLLQQKYLIETKGHSLIVFIRFFSIHVPEWKVYPVFYQSLKIFYRRFPRKKIHNLFLNELKSISEKKFETAEHKYLKKIILIDRWKITHYLEDYFLIRSFQKALYQEVPEFFDEFKESILDVETEIQFYFASRDHDPSKLEALLLKLFKTKPPKRVRQETFDRTTELFNQAYHSFKANAFKDSFTQNDFESFLKFILAIFSETKKFGISTEVFQNLPDYIHTVNNSKDPKYLFLHKLFQILFPSQFTSVNEWEASRKTSAINKNGFYVKEAKEYFISEVKKFLRLY